MTVAVPIVCDSDNGGGDCVGGSSGDGCGQVVVLVINWGILWGWGRRLRKIPLPPPQKKY